jgi:hypothetical protein
MCGNWSKRCSSRRPSHSCRGDRPASVAFGLRPTTRLFLEPLEDRVVPSVFSDLDHALGMVTTLESNLEAIVNKVHQIPFLDQASHQVGDFLNSQLNQLKQGSQVLTKLDQALKNADQEGLDPNNQATDTAIEQAITGANIPSVINPSVHVTSDSSQAGESIEVDLQVHLVLASISLPIGANLSFGLPGLPISFGAHSKGSVDINVTFDCQVAFGFSTENGHNGFFWKGMNLYDGYPQGNNPNPKDQMAIEATAMLSNNASLAGTVGILQATLTDFNDQSNQSDPLRGPTKMDVTFHVAPFNDISNIPAPSLTGSAHVSLTITGGFTDANGNALGPIKIPNLNNAASFTFPSVSTTFLLNWNFLGTAPAAADISTVGFGDVQVNLGSFLSSFVQPVVQVIEQVTAPLQPILNFLNTPIPGVSDFSHLVGQGDVTPLTVLDKVAPYVLGPAAEPLVDLIGELVKTVNDIDNLFGNNAAANAANGLSLDLGSFDLNNQTDTLFNPPQQLDLNPNDVNSAINGIQSVLTSIDGHLPQAVQNTINTAVGDISNVLQAVLKNGFSFDFPILDDPVHSLFPLLLGKDVDLFSFTGTLIVPKPTGQPPDLFGSPVSFYGVDLSFPIDLGFDAYFRIAYDTYGIRKFLQDPNKNAADLLDGFYVDDKSHFSVSGTVGPALGVDINPVFSLTLKGGLETGNNGNDPFTITFDDPNNNPQLSTYDGGKDRLTSLVSQNCFFDATGELDAGITLEVKIGYTFFNQFIGVTQDFDIAHVTLFSGNGTCLGQPGLPPLVLGNVSNNGTLYLNLGGTLAQQWSGSLQDATEMANYVNSLSKPVETFTVTKSKQQAGGPGESFDVTAFGITKTFDHVTSVVADATGLPYDENISLDNSVDVPATLTGGQKNNTLTYLGSGDATLNAGQDQQSQLTGGTRNNILNAGTGTDVLIGGHTQQGDSNTFFGGSGPDQFYAGPTSDDTMNGGSGDDTMTAGGGHDRMIGGTGRNTYIWMEGDGPLDVTGHGISNLLSVTGETPKDAFTASAQGAGIAVLAPGGVPINGTQIDTLNLDGTGDGDTYTVNDLSGTGIKSVSLNAHEAAAGQGAADTVMINGSANLPNLVEMKAEDVQVPSVDAQGNPIDVPGVVSNVELITVGDTGPGPGGPPSQYTVTAAIPKPDDTLRLTMGGVNDTVRVDSTQPSGHVYVNTGGGDDTITVGDPAGGLDDFQGPLDIAAGAGHNQIIFDNHASRVNDTDTLTATQLIRSTQTNQVTFQDPATGQTVTQVGFPFVINYMASNGGDFAPANGTPGVIFDTAYGATNLYIPETGFAAPTEVNCDGGYLSSIDDIVVGYDGQGQTLFPKDAGQGTLDHLHSSLTVRGAGVYQTLPGSILVVDDRAAPAGETYTVGVTTPQTGFVQRGGIPTITYDIVAMTLLAGNHGNLVDVSGVAKLSSATVDAGNGSDAINVGNQSNSLNDIGGALVIDGQGGTNTLTMHDDGTVTGQIYQLGANKLSRQQVPLLTIGFIRVASVAFYASNNAVLNTISVTGTPQGVPVDVYTGSGMADLDVGPLDQIKGSLTFHWNQGIKFLFVDDSKTTAKHTYTLSPGLVQRTQAALIKFGKVAGETLYAGFNNAADIRVLATAAGSPLTIVMGASADLVELSPTQRDLANLKSTVDVQGGGNTELDVNDQSASGRTYQLSSSLFQASGGPAFIFYSNLSKLVPNAGSSATVQVQGTPAGTNVAINLGAGTNQVTGGLAGDTLAAILGPLTVTGQTGKDSLILDDQNDQTITYIVHASAIDAGNLAPIQFVKMGSVTLNGSKSNIFYTIAALPATRLTINGQNTNILTGPNQNNLWVISGLNSGSLDNRITFTNSDELIGGTGNDDFVFKGTGALGGASPFLSGGLGNDALDFRGLAKPVAVNVTGPGFLDGIRGSSGPVPSFSDVEAIYGSAGSTLDASKYISTFAANLLTAGFAPISVNVSGDFTGSLVADTISSVHIGGNFSGQIVTKAFGVLSVSGTTAATAHVWVERTGSFTVVQGALIGKQSTNLATVFGLHLLDVNEQADIALTANQSVGLVARYDAATNSMYLAVLQDNGNGTFTASIDVIQNGQVKKVLATGTSASGSGTLKFVVQTTAQGVSLQLFLGNTLLASGIDTSPLTSDGVGVQVGSGTSVSDFTAA